MRKLLIFFFFIIPFIFAFDAYPGYDTLKWCRFEPHSSGYTGSGKYFGYGIKLTPQYYPAIISGVYHRVFRLYHSAMHIRIVDDDGNNGSPQTTLFFFDTLATNYSLSFIYQPIPPKCTIWDGSFYLFILNGVETTNALNWLRDSFPNAPPNIHWRYSQINGYTPFSPAGDLQICAVVEYHDVGIESMANLPDTLYVGSLARLDLWVKEYAGFFEREVPIIFNIDNYYDTLYLPLYPNSSVRQRYQWQVNLLPGNYLLKFYTNLRSDARKENDTIRKPITILARSAIKEKKEKEKNLTIYNPLGQRIKVLKKGIFFIKEDKKLKKKIIIKN
jgi:hypothetical protein